MRVSTHPTSSLLLSALAIVYLFAMTTSAQDSTGLPNLSEALSSQASEAASTTAPATSAEATRSTATRSSSGVVITATGSVESGASQTVPVITGGSSAANLPSGLPKLSGGYTVIPASVPPTNNAPYMQVSSLPEGTVFIIVGSILGFFGMSVLLWRGLVAWSLHRSVKRANMQQYMPVDAKSQFRTPAAPFYKYTDRDSTISLSGLGKGGKKSGRPQSGTMPAASASSLFFSPTAGVSNTPGNRGSNYLPAGYYAAGASAPGNGQGTTNVSPGPYQSNISLSNLEPRPASQGYSRTVSSPPGSPGYHPHHAYGASGSSLNLNQPPGEQRTPSVYLDDLFDGSGPPPPPPQHGNFQGGGRPF
ncbi:Vacuolar membrane protein [Phlyctema vagabunda]|uniref:Vacuolar membrane protein n=1 Tax=Phlyctema vagabunda TaxID=108571 RepID=A0ABR4P4I7_9HELO